ncbi:PEP-CTERM sorting domain-containing protein [Salinisphaera aquimarina]|uniref:PEP-CTERM sorting domain-containing protein n=1 Tax=Salinisphaera aquimarina TaxID=2094031 RepID=A0ABV7EM00_9GAMM
MLKSFLAATTIVAGFAFAGSASATQIDFFNDAGADVNFGSQSTFDGLRVRAFGYNAPFAQTNNFRERDVFQYNGDGRFAGNSAKYGVGVSVDANMRNTLDRNEFLSVDFARYARDNAGFFDNNILFTIGSLDAGDIVDFYIGQPNHENSVLFGSLTGTAGDMGLGSFLIAGSEFMLPNGGFGNLYLVGNNGGVTLQSIKDVPEPGSLALFALGLFGLGYVVRKRNIG